MELSILIERMVALTYLTVGTSMVLHSAMWRDLVLELKKSHWTVLVMAFFGLPFGLVIVFTHNVWQWHPNVIVTIMGWAAIVKSVLYLLYPQALWKVTPSCMLESKFIMVWGLVLAVLCAWVLHASF